MNTTIPTYGRYRYEQLSPIELCGLYADLGRVLGVPLRKGVMHTLLVLGANPEPGETVQARVSRVVAAIDRSSAGELSSFVRGLLERPWADVVEDLDVLSFALAEALRAVDGRTAKALMIQVLVHAPDRPRGGLSYQVVPNAKEYVPITTTAALDEQFPEDPLGLMRVFAWALMVNLRPITAGLATSLASARPTSPSPAPAQTSPTPGPSTS